MKLLITVILFCCSLVNVFATNAESLKTIVNDILREEEPNLINSNPDGKVSSKIVQVENFIVSINKELEESDSFATQEQEILFQKAMLIISALEERRFYRYLYWVERQLRESSIKEFDKCSQEELFEYYRKLLAINIDEIRETILAGEVAKKLAEIYERLDKENKPQARIYSIQKRVDFYTKEKNKKEGAENVFKPRKTPADF